MSNKPADVGPSALQAADFYKPDSYSSSHSVGFLMKRVMMALVTDVDRQLEAHSLTHAQWAPLFLLRQGRINTLLEAVEAAAQRQVNCIILADAVGSQSFFRSSWPRRLRRAGVKVQQALPVGPWRTLLPAPTCVTTAKS